jgi:hypothetical protein
MIKSVYCYVFMAAVTTKGAIMGLGRNLDKKKRGWMIGVGHPHMGCRHPAACLWKYVVQV